MLAATNAAGSLALIPAMQHESCLVVPSSFFSQQLLPSTT